jgi:hypothetical protein
LLTTGYGTFETSTDVCIRSLSGLTRTSASHCQIYHTP